MTPRRAACVRQWCWWVTRRSLSLSTAGVREQFQWPLVIHAPGAPVNHESMATPKIGVQMIHISSDASAMTAEYGLLRKNAAASGSADTDDTGSR
jgi:hypothetical protein